jgi:hypothetical protein
MHLRESLRRLLGNRTGFHSGKPTGKPRRLELEALEARCVPAQVLLGNILKETFDDPGSFTSFANGYLGANSFDDIGRIPQVDPFGNTTYHLTPVFHHKFDWIDFGILQSGRGTTVPTAPQDVAGDLYFVGGSDTITFPDVNNATEGVQFAAIDVLAFSIPVTVDFVGDNGTISFTEQLNQSGAPIVLEGSVNPNPSGPGYSVVAGNNPLPSGWATLAVGAEDVQVNGTPLGMIHSIIVHGAEAEFDNVRAVIFPRAPSNFTMNDVNVTVEPGVPKQINVLQNDYFTGNPPFSVGSVSGASLGTPVVTGGALVTYTAGAHAHGKDSFTYTVVNGQGPVVDAQGNAAKGKVNVLVNTPPVAPLLTMTVPHGTVGTFTGQSQITVPPDADGDPLTITRFADGNFGTVTVTQTSPTTASFTYTRTDGGVIQPDTFFYQVSDGFETAVGRVQLVPDTRPLDKPVDDLVPLAHGYHGPVTINVLANDPYPQPNGSDPVGPFGDPLQLRIVQQPAYGEAHINPDNTITYTPHQRTLQPDGTIIYSIAPDPNGLVLDDTFTYALFDPIEGLLSNSATVHLVPANHAPVAQDLHLSHLGSPGSPVTDINLLALGSDADNDPLQVFYSADNGTLQLQPNGLYTLVPNNAHVVHAQIHFRLTDGYTESNGATVYLDWDHIPAVAADEHFYVDIYNSYVNNYIRNENDFTDAAKTRLKDSPIGPNLFAANPDVQFNAAGPNRRNPGFPAGTPLDDLGLAVTLRIVDQPTRGNLTVNPDGTFTYSPYVYADGTLVLPDGLRTDSFTYVLNDGSEDSNVATVTLTPRRRELIVRSDVVSFAADRLENNLAYNDSFPDGTSLLPRQDVQTVSVSGQPTGGSFTLTGGPLQGNAVTVSWNETADQLRLALEAVVGQFLHVTCSGGPLPDHPIYVTWLRDKPQDVMTVGSNNLTGGPGLAAFVTHRSVGNAGNYLFALVLRSPVGLLSVNGPYLNLGGAPAGNSASEGDIISYDGRISYVVPNASGTILGAHVGTVPANFTDSFSYSVEYRANDDPNAPILDTYDPGFVSGDPGVAPVYVSNDPNDTHGDGVPDAVENQAYQGTNHVGDGNLDGIPDVQQLNVASLPNAVDGRYVTLVAQGTSPHQPPPEFASVETKAQPFTSQAALPNGANAPIGFFRVDLAGEGAGAPHNGRFDPDGTTVTLWMPPGFVPTAFFALLHGLHDPLQDFSFDPRTGLGAEILPPGVDQTTGQTLPARVVLHLGAIRDVYGFEGAPVTGWTDVANAVNGSAVALVPSAGTQLAQAAAVYPAQVLAGSGPSDGATFPEGLFQYTIQGVSPGGSTTLEMILPANMPLDLSTATFYKFGPTPQNHTPHWYQFLYHIQTDADDASMTGAQFLDSTHILLHFVDGQRGDDDLSPDGVIEDPGGPAVFSARVAPTPELGGSSPLGISGHSTPNDRQVLPARTVSGAGNRATGSSSTANEFRAVLVLGTGQEPPRQEKGTPFRTDLASPGASQLPVLAGALDTGFRTAAIADDLTFLGGGGDDQDDWLWLQGPWLADGSRQSSDEASVLRRANRRPNQEDRSMPAEEVRGDNHPILLRPEREQVDVAWLAPCPRAIDSCFAAAAEYAPSSIRQTESFDSEPPAGDWEMGLYLAAVGVCRVSKEGKESSRRRRPERLFLGR